MSRCPPFPFPLSPLAPCMHSALCIYLIYLHILRSIDPSIDPSVYECTTTHTHYATADDDAKCRRTCTDGTPSQTTAPLADSTVHSTHGKRTNGAPCKAEGTENVSTEGARRLSTEFENRLGQPLRRRTATASSVMRNSRTLAAPRRGRQGGRASRTGPPDPSRSLANRRDRMLAAEQKQPVVAAASGTVSVHGASTAHLWPYSLDLPHAVVDLIVFVSFVSFVSSGAGHPLLFPVPRTPPLPPPAHPDTGRRSANRLLPSSKQQQESDENDGRQQPRGLASLLSRSLPRQQVAAGSGGLQQVSSFARRSLSALFSAGQMAHVPGRLGNHRWAPWLWQRRKENHPDSLLALPAYLLPPACLPLSFESRTSLPVLACLCLSFPCPFRLLRLLPGKEALLPADRSNGKAHVDCLQKAETRAPTTLLDTPSPPLHCIVFSPS